jgi:hypothetical protein
MGEDRCLLIIADIGGYTRFMRLHRLNLAHAQVIVSRLLRAVVESAPDLDLIEFEGDAAFFCTPLPQVAAHPTRLSQAMHQAFHTAQERMVALNMCNCDACLQVGQLKLKFVAHLGEVAQEEIGGKTHLVGVDVIAVHRMLKNAVPVSEYVLMTEELCEQYAPEDGPSINSIEQELEGLGPATLLFVDLDEIALEPAEPPPATLPRRLRETMGVAFRGFPAVVGLRRTGRELETPG